jgi:transposase-like protein
VAHRNARTTVYARQLIVERHRSGWPAARIAEQLGVSRTTVHKWIRRHREEGPTVDQRESRAVQPNLARRVRLCTALAVQH